MDWEQRFSMAKPAGNLGWPNFLQISVEIRCRFHFRVLTYRRISVAKPKHPIVIAIDGTSASGKSTNSKLVARALGFVHVDTGAMYRTLAWYCLNHKVDVHDPKAVATACRRWKTSLECVDNHVNLLVDGYYPALEIRTNEVS